MYSKQTFAIKLSKHEQINKRSNRQILRITTIDHFHNYMLIICIHIDTYNKYKFGLTYIFTFFIFYHL